MLPPDDYKPISFDVTSLFTNVPLDYTISIILKQIYNQRDEETKISIKEMKDLLLLCTKNVLLLEIINCKVEKTVLQWDHP